MGKIIRVMRQVLRKFLRNKSIKCENCGFLLNEPIGNVVHDIPSGGYGIIKLNENGLLMLVHKTNCMIPEGMFKDLKMSVGFRKQ